jgi:L,D-peptidoglycan transpeptidase YkuD (ErfK/YbiS/YcfS/YnhG family)
MFRQSKVFRYGLILTILSFLACTRGMLKPSPSTQPLQAVVVLTDSWDAPEGSLQLFERESAHAPWRAASGKYAAVVGRNGLGWGMGLHDAPPAASAPIKYEGDGRAPAGVFLLSSAFGYASPESARWISLPYQQVTASLVCVDDANSRFYNQILDSSNTPAQWSSQEELLRNDELHKMGIVVSHNAPPAISGRGSCIFIHIWKAPSQGTNGGTAMAESDLREVLQWLNPTKTPVLVQLPRSEYDRYRGAWSLP